MKIIELSNESAVQLHGLNGIAMYVSSSIEALCPASGFYLSEIKWVGFYFYAFKQQYYCFVSTIHIIPRRVSSVSPLALGDRQCPL